MKEISKGFSCLISRIKEVKWTTDKIFSLIVVLYPVLNFYASPINMITLSEFLVIIFGFHVILLKKLKCSLAYEVLPFICLVMFEMIISPFLSRGNMFDAVGTGARLVFIYLFLAVFARKYFNYSFAVKCIHVVSCIVSLYAIIQVVFAKFDIYLINYIPIFTDLPNGGHTFDEVLGIAEYDLVFRPRSIFREPSAVACYLTLALVLALFPRNKNKFTFKLSIFYSIAMLLLRSSTAVIILATVWGLYLIKVFLKQGESKRNLIITLCGVLVGLLIFLSTDLYDTFLESVFRGDISLKGLGNSTRFRQLYVLLDVLKKPWTIIFGCGLHGIQEYLPGFFRVFYNMGMVGIGVIAHQFWKLYINANKQQKIIVVFYAILNIGTEILFGCFGVTFLAFILGDKKEL